MRDILLQVNKQFAFEPKLENADVFRPYDTFVVAGMGGSHLAADLLKIWKPSLNLLIHSDYGFPDLPEYTKGNVLLIAVSYSGNTEEVLNAYAEANKKGIPRVVVAMGGKLLELAKQDGSPYIQIPDTRIQPRMATAFLFKSLLRIVGDEKSLKEIGELAQILKPEEFEVHGQDLARKLKGFIPIIYASTGNVGLAVNWKARFNETAKIPAFYNVLPELNHNEMTGFDPVEATKNLSEKFFFIFLRDQNDNPRILKRMEVLEHFYRDRGLPIVVLELSGKNSFDKIFSSLMFADWTAYQLSQIYGTDPLNVPLVEEFKKLIG